MQIEEMIRPLMINVRVHETANSNEWPLVYFTLM